MVAIARSRPATAFALNRARLEELAEVLPFVLLVSMAAFFGWWYGRVLYQLPLFGDAANHARISREMLDHGLLNTSSPYPPLYNMVGEWGLYLAGTKGFISVTVASVVLLGVGVYFLAEEITGSRPVALVSALIAYLSPKTPFYAGRLYMEVFLVVLFLFAFLYIHRYLRTRRASDMLLAALFCGLAAITKQQGLLLLAAPAGMFFLIWEGTRWIGGERPVRFHALIIYLPVVAALVLPSVFWQVRNTGQFLPESKYTSKANIVARDLVGYEPRVESWHAKWDTYLDQAFADGGYYIQGTQAHESRHVWPTDVLTTDRGFFGIHSLLWGGTPGGSALPEPESRILEALFATGLLVWAITSRQKSFLGFVGLFLLANYAAFESNNDQLRYHLYIAYIFAFILPLAVFEVSRRVSPAIGLLSLACAAILLCAFALRYLPDRTEYSLGYIRTQAYAPSRGGISSVEEASTYIRTNLPPSGSFFAIPDTEFAYYVQRKSEFDYRLYFSTKDDLRAVFRDMGVSYVVIPDSATLPDDKWNHLGKAPASFVLKVSQLYAKVFTTRAGDISVYRVR